MKLSSLLFSSVLLLAAGTTQAALIEVSFTAGANTAYAPTYIDFSSTANPIVQGGATASAGLELLAEVGDGSLIATERAATGAVGTANLFGGPTLFGTTATAQVEVDASTPFFNFAAMVLPTNDWFIGTGASVAPLDISSLLGGGVTSLTLEFFDFYDAGTELEDFNFAAPGSPPNGFNPVAGAMPGGGVDQNGTISLITFQGAGDENPFEVFSGPNPGVDISQFDPRGGAVGTITLTLVPEPSTALLGSLGLMVALRRRRRA